MHEKRDFIGYRLHSCRDGLPSPPFLHIIFSFIFLLLWEKEKLLLIQFPISVLTIFVTFVNCFRFNHFCILIGSTYKLFLSLRVLYICYVLDRRLYFSCSICNQLSFWLKLDWQMLLRRNRSLTFVMDL